MTAAPITAFARTLEQELFALLRGASLECLVCGEFVMHAHGGAVFCPECGSQCGSQCGSSKDSTEAGVGQAGSAGTFANTS